MSNNDLITHIQYLCKQHAIAIYPTIQITVSIHGHLIYFYAYDGKYFNIQELNMKTMCMVKNSIDISINNVLNVMLGMYITAWKKDKN